MGFSENMQTIFDSKPLEKKILDSGDRTSYETGAVRDTKANQGRCDLMPLDIMANVMNDAIVTQLALFQITQNTKVLYDIINRFTEQNYPSKADMFLELSIHFKQGAEKYGEENWRKGIPVHSYFDSAIRHYMKFIRGDNDEPHDRAFIWNLVCMAWTIENKPEMNDLYSFTN
ncbi:MAG: DUF5664 domain-containing protein [Lachnospiraceae bacterium]|nr:DUF5664 domain-containing protein [Lachnospiraceae bacterium]